jgi:hypothetical protein
MQLTRKYVRRQGQATGCLRRAASHTAEIRCTNLLAALMPISSVKRLRTLLCRTVMPAARRSRRAIRKASWPNVTRFNQGMAIRLRASQIRHDSTTWSARHSFVNECDDATVATKKHRRLVCDSDSEVVLIDRFISIFRFCMCEPLPCH